MNMKKIFLIFLMALTILSACSNNNSADVKICLPDGTPALAMANLLNEDSQYDIEIVNADSISGLVASKSCDLAILPTVAAAKLYSNGSNIKIVSANVFGNLYICGNQDLESLDLLVGKMVYTTVGTTMDLFKYILDANQIEYVEGSQAIENKVTLCSKSDATEIIQLIKLATTNNEFACGILGEPVVTKALGMIEGLKINFDLQQLYGNISGEINYPQACLVAQADFCNNNSAIIDEIIESLSANSDFLYNNLEDLPAIFSEYNSSLGGMSFTSDTIKRSNIDLLLPVDCKEMICDYVYALTKITLADDIFR